VRELKANATRLSTAELVTLGHLDAGNADEWDGDGRPTR